MKGRREVRMQTGIVGLVIAVLLSLNAPGEAIDPSRPLECGENTDIRCIEPKPKEERVALRPIV